MGRTGQSYLDSGPLQDGPDAAGHVVQRAALLGGRQERQLGRLAVELERGQQLACTWDTAGIKYSTILLLQGRRE